MDRARRTDIALFTALSLLWGFSYLFISVALKFFSPILLGALRFDIAALAMFAVAAVRTRGRLWPSGPAAWSSIAIAGMFNIALYHALLFSGQAHTTPGIAAIIVGLNPILTTIASRFLLAHERVGVGGFLGLVLGFSGIAFLAALKPGSTFDVQGIGEFLIVGGIACWALGSVLVKRREHTMEITLFVAWQALFGAILMHAMSLAWEPDPVWSLETKALTALGYLALLASGVGLNIFFVLVRRVGPIRGNLVSYLTAIVASIAAWIIMGHEIEPRAVIAFVAIAIGFLLVVRRRKEDVVAVVAPE